jgi:hypothetical protein
MDMVDSEILIPSLLMPPSKLFAALQKSSKIIIDDCETYPKQTLRNRYYLGGPNDIISLVVPVKKPFGHKTKTNEILIDYSTNWALYHKKTITTSYSKSPFFLYYSDYIFDEFEKKHQKLTELNYALMKLFFKWLHITAPIEISHEYIHSFEQNDLRKLCKSNLSWELENIYNQPFDNIFGFRNSLSILDIMFNLGPQTKEYLRKETNYANLQNS